MDKLIATGKKTLQRSFFRYVIIGGSTFALDFALLILLHDVLGLNLLIAASISYWTSIIFNFFANRIWTFKADETSMGQNAVLYLLLLGFNFVFNIGFIAGATHLGMHYALAKVIAVAMQVVWTYVLYKKVVFKKWTTPATPEEPGPQK